MVSTGDFPSDFSFSHLLLTGSFSSPSNSAFNAISSPINMHQDLLQPPPGFDIKPVLIAPFSSGKGLPYAHVDWPSPGDVWTYRVGRRVNSSGSFTDRFLYLPERLHQPKVPKYFASKKSLTLYIQSNFPDSDVDAFFASFIWKIPALLEPANEDRNSRKKQRVTYEDEHALEVLHSPIPEEFDNYLNSLEHSPEVLGRDLSVLVTTSSPMRDYNESAEARVKISSFLENGFLSKDGIKLSKDQKKLASLKYEYNEVKNKLGSIQMEVAINSEIIRQIDDQIGQLQARRSQLKMYIESKEIEKVDLRYRQKMAADLILKVVREVQAADLKKLEWECKIDNAIKREEEILL